MNAWDIQTRESFKAGSSERRAGVKGIRKQSRKAGRVLTLRLPANISYNAQQQINSILANL